jgi:hypothetical protein
MPDPFNYQDYARKMNNPPPYADLSGALGDLAGVGGEQPSDFGRLLNWMQGTPNPPYGRTNTAIPVTSRGIGGGFIRAILKDIAGSSGTSGGFMPPAANSSATGLAIPPGGFSRGPNMGLAGRMDTAMPADTTVSKYARPMNQAHRENAINGPLAPEDAAAYYRKFYPPRSSARMNEITGAEEELAIMRVLGKIFGGN